MYSVIKPIDYKRIVTWGLFLTLIFTLLPPSIQLTLALSEQEIRDAILGKTEPDFNTMDLNEDDEVDVADLVFYLGTRRMKMLRYVGIMAFDSEVVLAPQNVELTLPGRVMGAAFQAEFSTENSPFFSGSFLMNGVFSEENQLSFTSSGTGVLEGDDPRNPLHRPITWELRITEATLEEGILNASFTISYTGFRYGEETTQVSGTMSLTKQLSDGTLLFENADDIDRLVQLYGL
jgi:hypothetical protein